MIAVEGFEGALFLKSSRIRYILKSRFHTESGVYLVLGVWWESLRQNQHLKRVLTSVDLGAVRSEGIWPGRHLLR